MKTWKILLLTVLAFVLGLAIMVSCGDDDDDDDDDDNDDAADDDDDSSDDDDSGDDDDDDDDDDDNDDSWAGPPWYGCTNDDEPEDATVVVAMDKAYHYYGSGDDFRTLSADVNFPTETDWSRITMRVELGCPEDGLCDAWDRLANLYLMTDAKEDPQEVLEIWRYITPYRATMCMLADVTEYAPYLTGAQTLYSFISTWVGPESGFQNGNGWTVTVKFIFHPAKKAELPDKIINVWPYQSVQVGDPANPIDSQIGDKIILLPATISKAEMRMTVTGHGQGNKSNCAEFCQLLHGVKVNATGFDYGVWRTDCSTNPIGPQQQGSWSYSRAGWCPGAAVIPEVFDITSALTPGTTNTFSYTITKPTGEEYENTCRPGAGDGDNYCEGCAFDQEPGNCDYNGGDHTSPSDYVSVQLFLWE